MKGDSMDDKEHLSNIRDLLKSGYDPELARYYGADEYGMKRYVLAFLKRGSKQPKTKAETDRLQKAHLENITRLSREGRLILAGPFLDEGELRGIYLFDTESLELAQQLVESDPAIQAGSLVMELKEWYGSAALMAVSQIHPMVEKRSVSE